MPRRVLEGNVVSAKADKTITVLVERRYMHTVYKKYVKSTSKYMAHDETNQFKEGDRVSIIECRPISKSKTWTVMVDGQVPAAPEKAVKKSAAVKKAAPKAEKVVKAKDAAVKDAPKKAAAKKTTAAKAKATKKDA